MAKDVITPAMLPGFLLNNQCTLRRWTLGSRFQLILQAAHQSRHAFPGRAGRENRTIEKSPQRKGIIRDAFWEWLVITRILPKAEVPSHKLYPKDLFVL